MSTEERTATGREPSAARPAGPTEHVLTPAEQAVADGLAPFRARLDQIDAQLVDLLGERFQICREVAVHKSEHEIAMMQPGRVQIVRARYLQHGAEVDLPADFTAGFFDLMIDATCRAEDELMERLAAGEHGASALSRRGDDQMQTQPGENGLSAFVPARRDQTQTRADGRVS
jgi:chorismate mutase